MNFGDAIEQAKHGQLIARAGWNGKGQYIELAKNISYVNPQGYTVNAQHDAIGNNAFAFVGTSGVQLGWLASQADMLAEDWQIVSADEKNAPELQGLELLRESLHKNTFTKQYSVGDVIKDFGYHFEIIGYYRNDPIDPEQITRPSVTLMAKELLPKHRMHGGECPNGWIDTELRKWLNTEVFDSLPNGLKTMIQPTRRLSTDCNGSVRVCGDKLFIPTESELFGSAIYSFCECGERYPAFRDSDRRICYNEKSDPACYWTSSACAGNADYFVLVDSDGQISGYCVSNASYAPLCFRICG